MRNRLMEALKRSALIPTERDNRFYLQIGSKRYVYEDGKCVGWYWPAGGPSHGDRR